MYKRQVSGRKGGGDNRTFAFWGRILVPAAVFLAFWEGFCMFFLCIRGYGGQNKFLIEKKKRGRILVLAGKNIGSACFLGALPDRTPHEFDIKWSTFIKYKLNCLYHTGYCLNCIYILYNFLSAAKGRVEKKKWKIPFWWMGGVSIWAIFHYLFFLKKNLKHWILPKSILKQTFFFNFWGGVEPSGNSQMTHIIQNQFHGMYIIFFSNRGVGGWGPGLMENIILSFPEDLKITYWTFCVEF